MILILLMMFMCFGLLLAYVAGNLPMMMFLPDPTMSYMLLGMAFVISFVGFIIVATRAKKTGAGHLLDFGHPDKILWFYIQKNAIVKISSGAHGIEGISKNKELDLIVQDKKTYRIYDHTCVFVPEHIGHTVNAKHVLYAKELKQDEGFENLRDGRKKIFKGIIEKEQKPPTRPNQPVPEPEIPAPSQIKRPYLSIGRYRNE